MYEPESMQHAVQAAESQLTALRKGSGTSDCSLGNKVKSSVELGMWRLQSATEELSCKITEIASRLSPVLAEDSTKPELNPDEPCTKPRMSDLAIELKNRTDCIVCLTATIESLTERLDV